MLVIKNLKTKLFSKGYSSVSVVARLAVAAAPATSAQLRHSHSRTPWSVRRKTRGIRRTEGQTPYTENRPSVALTHTQTHSMPLPTTRLSHGTSNKSWMDAELRIGNAGAHCPRVFQHRMKSDTLAPPLLLDPSLQHKTGEKLKTKRLRVSGSFCFSAHAQKMRRFHFGSERQKMWSCEILCVVLCGCVFACT